MKVDLGIWQKLTRLVAVLCIVAGLVGVGLWYLPLIQQNDRMRQKVQQLDEQIRLEKEAEAQAKTAIESQRNDPKAVDRLAREKLGYAKPGETVFHFEPGTTNSATR